MKCKVCNAESGKYPLCRACYYKKEKGEIIKCEKCGESHYKNISCNSNGEKIAQVTPPVEQAPVVTETSNSNTTVSSNPTSNNDKYLYNLKNVLISKNEQNYLNTIKSMLPNDYYIFPQINLASIIERTDESRFHNELFRNVDFLITNSEYEPKIIIEINDQTHLNKDRKDRDEKVKKICEEAGIPIINLWTSYGIKPDYIKERITKVLNDSPSPRIHHFHNQSPKNNNQKGCYIATCVYGSYDCPEVWILRRYRDITLEKSIFGKAFIKAYYALSPYLVKIFGNHKWFVDICKHNLDNIVNNLQRKGYENTPYND